GVLARKRAMGPMPALESPLPAGRTGGQAPDLPQDFCAGQPREVRYLRWAIEQALLDSGFEEKEPPTTGSSNPKSKIENRKSNTLARVLGYGETSDSHHLTQPHPEGEGAARAIRAALSSANLPPQAIELISAHATSTPNNDAAEFAAISQVFGDRTK